MCRKWGVTVAEVWSPDKNGFILPNDHWEKAQLFAIILLEGFGYLIYA